MANYNKHGLSRYIPIEVRREVRQRSKFGCVICRRGFYQYEHIDPPFEDATEHNPDHICCLCGSCHDDVTRGRRSKASVKAAYHKIQRLPNKRVHPPIGPLDFHDGNVELSIGGLTLNPAIRTILRYHGQDIIKIFPSERQDEPGRISAVFTNDEGIAVLRLEENEWIGSLDNWDIEVVRKRITIRRDKGRVVLQLRLDPPGRIVVEHLDMRIVDGHIIATENGYAVGRYITRETLHWILAYIQIKKSSPWGAAIEFAERKELERRDVILRDKGQELASADRDIVFSSNSGIVFKEYGIAIASLCGAWVLGAVAVFEESATDMRRKIFEDGLFDVFYGYYGVGNKDK